MQIININHSTGIFRFMLFVLCSLILGFQGMAQTDGGNQNQRGGDENRRVESLSETAGEGSMIPTDEETVARGRELFGQHCNVCHGIEKQIIGPALASIHQRRPLAWTISFVKNSQRMIHEEEDEYAQQIFKQYNQQVMPPFEYLSNDDIVAVIAYIKSESEASTAYGGINNEQGGDVDQSPEANVSSGDEAYSQKDDGQQKSDEVSSGIPGALTFGLIIGTLILIGIIYAVARKSSASKSSRKAK